MFKPKIVLKTQKRFSIMPQKLNYVQNKIKLCKFTNANNKLQFLLDNILIESKKYNIIAKIK